MAHGLREAWRHGSLGNPVGQARIVKRLSKAGGLLLTSIGLKPGKRARFELHVGGVVGYDPDRDELITEDSPSRPFKPWLAVTITTTRGLGPQRAPEIDASILTLVSHHALSRIAQRCGARDPRDLLLGVRALFAALTEAEIVFADDIPPGGHLLVKFANGIETIAALERHRNPAIDAVVVPTILPPGAL
jgi:hypothetical protein